MNEPKQGTGGRLVLSLKARVAQKRPPIRLLAAQDLATDRFSCYLPIPCSRNWNHVPSHPIVVQSGYPGRTGCLFCLPRLATDDARTTFLPIQIVRPDQFGAVLVVVAIGVLGNLKNDLLSRGAAVNTGAGGRFGRNVAPSARTYGLVDGARVRCPVFWCMPRYRLSAITVLIIGMA